MLATGHYRNGILLAPITAEAMAAVARGRRSRPTPRGRARAQSASRRWRADDDRAQRQARRSCATAPASPRRSPRPGAEAQRRGVAVAVEGEVVPRGRVGRDEPARRPGGRGRAGDPGWTMTQRETRAASAARAAARAGGFELGGRTWGSRLIVGSGGFRSLEDARAGARRLGDRDRHRGAAPRRSARAGLGARRRRAARRSSRCPTRPAATRRATPCAPRSSRARRSRPTGSSSR